MTLKGICFKSVSLKIYFVKSTGVLSFFQLIWITEDFQPGSFDPQKKFTEGPQNFLQKCIKFSKPEAKSCSIYFVHNNVT